MPWFGSQSNKEAREMRKAGWYVTSRVRVACRYAKLMGLSITQAAREWDLNTGAVWNAWERIYPDIPHPCSDVNNGRPIGSVNGIRKADKALELLDQGMSPREAARKLGLSHQSVYDARKRRVERMTRQAISQHVEACGQSHTGGDHQTEQTSVAASLTEG